LQLFPHSAPFRETLHPLITPQSTSLDSSSPQTPPTFIKYNLHTTKPVSTPPLTRSTPPLSPSQLTLPSPGAHPKAGMDTSTLTFTLNKTPPIPKTSSLFRQPVQPVADWFTRLISPLTHTEESSSSPRSTSVMIQEQFPIPPDLPHQPKQPEGDNDGAGFSTMLLVFIPILVVVLTVLLGLVCFLAAVLYMRRRKGIRWVDRVISIADTDSVD